MPVFEYKALDSKGKKLRGLITADYPAAPGSSYPGPHLPTEIREVKEEKKTFHRSACLPLAKLQRVNPVKSRRP
jgi:hypothetical protein